MRTSPTPAAALSLLLAAAAALPTHADAFDAPDGHYDGVSGVGAVLERSLAERLRTGHTQRSYGDFRDAASVLDADPDRPGNVLLAYDRASAGGDWDSGRTWNREHVWPQSRQPGSASNASRGNLGDHHALRPVAPGLNTSRGNEPFAGRGLTGTARRVAGGFFPGDADRGDVARSLFYSSTRYGLELGPGDPSGDRMGNLDALVAWHYLDAPDLFERRRNHAVFSPSLNPRFAQNNRNAYVDLPEAVWSVFVDQENDSRLSIAGVTPDADGGSSLTRTETVYRGAQPAGPGTRALVLVAGGADPTYYRVTAAGVLELGDPSGGGGGADTLRAAVGPADLDEGPAPVAFRLAGGLTGSVGRRSGSLTVDNLDLTLRGGRGRGGNDADDVFAYELTVLDHAAPSLAADATQTAGSLDLGAVALGGGVTGSVAVFNRASDPAFTADLLSGDATGDDARVTARGFDAVAGGGSGSAPVGLRGLSLGEVNARVTLGTAEPAFRGVRGLPGLELAVTGRVALPGDATLDGRVDARDAAAFRVGRAAATAAPGYADGDFDRDGSVGAADLGVFGGGFGLVEEGGRAARSPGSPAAASLPPGFVNPDAGDGAADFLYDAATGDLVVDPDGEALWSVALLTLAEASATGSPAAAWAFAAFGDALQATDRTAGDAAATDAWLLARLDAGLEASAFGGVRFFALGSNAARGGSVVLLVPEPGTLLLLLAAAPLLSPGRPRR